MKNVMNKNNIFASYLISLVDKNMAVESYEVKDEDEAITHFERKYVSVGVKLYQFSCNLGPRKSLGS